MSKIWEMIRENIAIFKCYGCLNACCCGLCERWIPIRGPNRSLGDDLYEKNGHLNRKHVRTRTASSSSSTYSEPDTILAAINNAESEAGPKHRTPQSIHTKKMSKKTETAANGILVPRGKDGSKYLVSPTSEEESTTKGVSKFKNRQSIFNSMKLGTLLRRNTGSQEEILINNNVVDGATGGASANSTTGGGGRSSSPSSKQKSSYQSTTNSPAATGQTGSHYNQSKFKEDTTKLAELYSSGAGEEEEHSNLGTIHFGLSYDFQSQNLIVKIIQAKSLPAKDITGTSDPYVRLFLLPDRKSKMETRMKKKCLNPIWNETFLYEGFPYHKLQNRILNLQVFDYDRFSKDDPIGEIFLPLNEVDLSQFPHYWKKLIPMDKSSKTGEILLTLTYLPGPGKLNIEIIKCKNLKASDVIGLSDPYITMWLLDNGKKILKQKTQIKFNTLSPVFQETFSFSIPTEKIRTASILLTAKDYDKYTRNDTIGSFLLASRSSPMETKHWKDMLLNPGKAITQWHFLKKN